jgi:hypothetical protein
MHAVPVPLAAMPSGLHEKFQVHTIRSLSDIKVTIPDSSYIFFEDCSRRRSVFTADRIPSQYLRKVVANSIGKNDWDWRERGREAELVSTVSRLLPLFSQLAPAQGQ